MSGSFFGSGYWPDDYFGLYWQPEAGGVIIGALSGSFAGASSFAGQLDGGAQPVAVNNSGYWGSDWRERKKTQQQRDEELLRDLKRALGMLEEAPAAVAAPVVEVIAPYVEAQITTVPPVALIDWRPFVEMAQKREALRAAIAEAKALQDQEDEDLFLLLAA